MRHSVLFSSALAVAAVVQLGGTHLQQEPVRPRLAATADTNDASFYFVYGLDHLISDPGQAADAFYWASRLDPRWAEALYARRVALLLTQSNEVLRNYIEGHEETIFSPEILRIDSLGYRAMMRSPFFHRGLDQYLLIAPSVEVAQRYARRGGDRLFGSREWVEQIVAQMILDGEGLQLGPFVDGWLAYANGKFPLAFDHFDKALNSGKDVADVELIRAGMFYYYGQYDSTRISLEAALDDVRQRDEEEDVIIYESKALLEFAVGFVLHTSGDSTGARAAYERALLEDFSFYPAHLRLAVLAEEAGDSTEALGALELAAEVATDDAVPHLALGIALFERGRHEEAQRHLQRAIALEPYYADAYLVLGQCLEAQARFADAIEQFTMFLDRASQNHSRREWATAHRDSLVTAARFRR